MSEALLALVDLLVVNRVEAEALAGTDVREPEQAVEAARALGRGARDVVVTLGAAGLVVAPRGVPPAFVPARKVAAVSAHGAGDCFLGALAARLAQGEELTRACRWASTAASLYVSLDAAAQAGMRAGDVEALGDLPSPWPLPSGRGDHPEVSPLPSGARGSSGHQGSTPICFRPSGVRSSTVARPSNSTSRSCAAKSGPLRPSLKAWSWRGRKAAFFSHQGTAAM